MSITNSSGPFRLGSLTYRGRLSEAMRRESFAHSLLACRASEDALFWASTWEGGVSPIERYNALRNSSSLGSSRWVPMRLRTYAYPTLACGSANPADPPAPGAPNALG